MDITPQNIKMCEMAEEIQKQFKGFHGDYYVPVNNEFLEKYHPENIGRVAIQGCVGNPMDRRHITLIDYNTTYFCTDIEDAVWLPRQDQLQEMIEWKSKYKLKFDFSQGMYWLRVLDRAAFMLYELSGLSMEQLWFAFVMKEKYNKQWTGEEWKETK